MKANDILRRVRYILDLDDATMIAVFSAAERDVTREQISAWLKRDGDPGYEEPTDAILATFLNGLINQQRGRKDGPQPDPEENLNNNVILVKLKIAFDLQADDMLSILSLADFYMSKHELSALFRRPGHKHFRDCKDQFLRNFLHGMQIKYRGTSVLDSESSVWDATLVKQ